MFQKCFVLPCKRVCHLNNVSYCSKRIMRKLLFNAQNCRVHRDYSVSIGFRQMPVIPLESSMARLGLRFRIVLDRLILEQC